MTSLKLRQSLRSRFSTLAPSLSVHAVVNTMQATLPSCPKIVMPFALLSAFAMPTAAMAHSNPSIALLQPHQGQGVASMNRLPALFRQAVCPSVSKTQSRRVALLWTAQTTLTLLNCGGQASVKYNSLFQNRRYTGGPIAVPGNGRWVLKGDPPVDVTISNFRRTASYLGFHIKVDVLKAGTHTIFDGNLGG